MSWSDDEVTANALQDCARLRREISVTTVQLNAAKARADAAEDALAKMTNRSEALELAMAELHRVYQAVTTSTAWKLTWPARSIVGLMPPVIAWYGRRTMRAARWILTPWAIPRRARALPQQRAAKLQTSAPVVAGPAVLSAAPPHGFDEARHLAADRADGRSSTFEDPEEPDVAFEEGFYLIMNPDVAAAIASGAETSAYEHWITSGKKEGRAPHPLWAAPPPDATSPPERTKVSLLLVGAQAAEQAGQLVQHLAKTKGCDWQVVIAGEDASVTQQGVVSVSCQSSAGRGEILAALLAEASGTWIAVLDAGDMLVADAGQRIEDALCHQPDGAILYSDEDRLISGGECGNPFFKPGWSPELLQVFNYFGRLTMLRRDLVLQAGGFLAEDGDGAEWGLNLRSAELAEAHRQPIERIAHVLCHRTGKTNPDRPDAGTAAAAALRAVLQRYWQQRGIEADIETQADGTQRSRWDVAEPPLVSIIIPSRGKAELLRRCLEGLRENTAYRHLEILIVESNWEDPAVAALCDQISAWPDARVLRFDGPISYSAACNLGAKLAHGELLLFLHNDIEIVDPSWLNELVRVVTMPGVGIAGTDLYYPDSMQEHVEVGIHLFGSVFPQTDKSARGLFGSPNTVRNCSATTGGCQIVRRSVFEMVGGFNEAYQIANSDVAFCLQAQRVGWRTVHTPFAALAHQENVTRSRIDITADTIRLAREMRRLGLSKDKYLHPTVSGSVEMPRLRNGGDPSLFDAPRFYEERFIAGTSQHELAFDIYDDSQVQAAVALPLDEISWAPQPVSRINDNRAAARWLIDLLRRRADLRLCYPRALSDGKGGTFCAWITGSGGERMGLSQSARRLIADVLAEGLAAPVLRLYFWRQDLRLAFPLGLTPAGRGRLAVCLLQKRRIARLDLEEIWWFLLLLSEQPAAGLVMTYLCTPEWQVSNPYGLTVFGRDRLAAWLADRYDLGRELHWLSPQSWPVALAPSEQLKLAYAGSSDWRERHPDGCSTEQGAARLLEWLASDAAGLPGDARAWCASRLGDGSAKLLAAPGVNIVGHFCYPSGLRVSAEAIADAVTQAGGVVSLRDIRTKEDDEPRHHMVGGLEIHDITLFHTQPEPFFSEVYRRSDLAERAPRTYRIAYWYWELETIPEGWVKRALEVDEIWAATDFVANALRTVSPVPVKKLFPGVQTCAFEPRRLRDFHLREDRFTFLFTFHMASVVERKNPVGLIRAFCAAFSPEEPVQLILKTTSFECHSEQMAELQAAIEGANIVLLDRVMSHDETLALMACCDAYVSLHRSEGLGLTMAEAMLLGKPVIATRYSGNLDFMDDNNSLLVDYELVPVGKPVPPYDAQSFWAKPSETHAAQLMQTLYEDQKAAKALGLRAQADARQRLSLARAGRKIVERLEEIRTVLRTRDGVAVQRQEETAC